jgi:putative ABC transport system ATP-binding protein
MVLEVLDQVNREFGTLVVVVTHNAVIGEMAHRVMHMSSGTIVEQRQNTQRLRVKDLTW